MDIIQECALNFEKMLNIEYSCIVSKNRNLLDFTINFKNTDFYHLAGLQYLTDIDINPNRAMTVSLARNGLINDELLSKSTYFEKNIFNQSNISSRINELRYLESYLDTDNMINIYNTRDGSNSNSLINAEYVIQSRRPGTFTDVYIFLRKRIESEKYLVVSFFVKGPIIYSGEKLYWMLKQKIQNGDIEELYRHKNFLNK